MGNYLNVLSDAERNYQKRIVDSKGQAGPTLQRIADRAKVHKNIAGMLEAMFEGIAPLGMYSGEAEGAYIPSKAMKNAQGLAKIFQDWYKTGTPTINVPFDKWPEILKSGKFKNQMELAGKEHPEAWRQRVEVEKALGGFPYPRTTIKRPYSSEKLLEDLYENDEILHTIKTDKSLIGIEKLTYLNKYLKEQKELLAQPKIRHDPVFSESLAKQNPVYGHIYNPKYTHEGTATGFGNTHAEMSDLVKEQSKYVLGDSFHPFVKTAFSSDDMLGNTSRLERALFNRNRPDWMNDKIKYDPQDIAKYMEMWVPNHLARLNNVRGVHVPGKAILDPFDRAVPIKELPNLVKQKQENISAKSLWDGKEKWDDLDPEDLDVDAFLAGDFHDFLKTPPFDPDDIPF